MVDRITPATAYPLRVVCEPFTQWVVEDTFPTGRPPREHAGVQLVDDVAPYELMKIRLLNGGHQVVAQLGAVAGHTYIHEAVADPAIRAMLLRYLDDEATPTLLPVPGIDLAEYKSTLLERLANPAIADTVARVCEDSERRIDEFLAPVVRAGQAAGRDTTAASAAVDAWLSRSR
jgi:mannitol 2-dehydrogenase